MMVLVGLPVATLVAGVATLAIIGRGGLDAVGDPVRRTAQVQQVDLGADAAARRLGLTARLAFEGERFRVAVPDLEGTVDLRLHLEHPLDAKQDLALTLSPGDGAWHGPAFDAKVGWRMALSPVDGAWRLVARWPRGAKAIDLAPAVASEDATNPGTDDGSG